MKLELRDYPRIAIFVGLIAALGLLPAVNILPGVPVTAQTLGVMLAGAVLGSYRGTLAVFIFEVLVAIGLPLLAGGRGGFAVFAGPTAGYLLGWLIGTWVIGAAYVWLKNLNYVLRAVVALVLGGIVAVYIPGILWFATLNKLPILAVANGNLPFLVGDSVKIVIAVLVLLGLKAAYPKALEN